MKKLLLSFALLVVSLSRVSATEYAFGDFDVTLNNSGHVAWLTPLDLELGKFATGFTPTMANADLWRASWISGPTGFYDPTGPEWGASLTLSNNTLFPVNSQLYVWAFNAVSGTNREWALFTDTNWRTVNNTAFDPSFYSFDFSASSVAVVGALDFSAHTAETARIASRVIVPVPEPATWGLIGGVSTLVIALWRRRRTR